MIPFAGYLPDADPTTPGLIKDCVQWIPYENGYEAAPSPTNASGVSPLAASCRGAAVMTLLDSTRRLFAGTQTKLYEVSSGSNTDVSRAGNYTGATDNRWIFGQFGNVSLATNYTDTMQFSNASGAFADIAGAPKAKTIVVVNGFVMALNYNNGTQVSDGWFCSGLNDYTIWTPSIATQCANGRLFGTEGAITAGARLGKYCVAFKDSAVYLGSYQGGNLIWAWDEISTDIGCVGPEACANLGNYVFFAHRDGLYIFDGSRPQDISVGSVKQFWQSDLNQIYRYRVIVNYDRQRDRVYVYYPDQSSSDGTPNACLVWHKGANKWGKASRTIQAALNYVQPAVTYDGIGGLYSTWDSLPAIAYDSPFWSSGSRAMAVYDNTAQLVTLTGVAATSSYTTGDLGDMDAVTQATLFRTQYITPPATASIECSAKMNEDDSYSVTQTINRASGKFDIRQSGRWHRFTCTHTGNTKAIGFDMKINPAGVR